MQTTADSVILEGNAEKTVIACADAATGRVFVKEFIGFDRETCRTAWDRAARLAHALRMGADVDLSTWVRVPQ